MVVPTNTQLLSSLSCYPCNIGARIVRKWTRQRLQCQLVYTECCFLLRGLLPELLALVLFQCNNLVEKREEEM